MQDDALSIHLNVTKSCSVKCKINWTRFPSTKAIGLTVSETGHSEESCKQACVDTVNCTGVNYYKGQSQTCWFGFDKDPVTVDDKSSVYMKLDWTCPRRICPWQQWRWCKM